MSLHVPVAPVPVRVGVRQLTLGQYSIEGKKVSDSI